MDAGQAETDVHTVDGNRINVQLVTCVDNCTRVCFLPLGL